MTPLELWQLNRINDWLNRKDRDGVKLRDDDGPDAEWFKHRAATLRGDYQ